MSKYITNSFGYKISLSGLSYLNPFLAHIQTLPLNLHTPASRWHPKQAWFLGAWGISAPEEAPQKEKHWTEIRNGIHRWVCVANSHSLHTGRSSGGQINCSGYSSRITRCLIPMPHMRRFLKITMNSKSCFKTYCGKFLWLLAWMGPGLVCS